MTLTVYIDGLYLEKANDILTTTKKKKASVNYFHKKSIFENQSKNEILIDLYSINE